MLLPDENKRITRDWRRQLMQVNDKEETERVQWIGGGEGERKK